MTNFEYRPRADEAPASQIREVCRRLIERQGWQLTETYIDRSISGANAANPPLFSRWLQTPI